MCYQYLGEKYSSAFSKDVHDKIPRGKLVAYETFLVIVQSGIRRRSNVIDAIE